MTAKSFQERSVGREQAPSSWKIVKLVFLRKPAEEWYHKAQNIALTSVLSELHATCVILRFEKGNSLEELKQFHVGGVDGVSCKHWQVMMTRLLQRHWAWQENRRNDV